MAECLRETFRFRNREVADAASESCRIWNSQVSILGIAQTPLIYSRKSLFPSYHYPTMSSEPGPSATASTASLWDRLTTWASENKAIVYTIAGTAVVITGAGAIFYFSDSRRTKTTPSTERKKSKKERRNEKKRAEEQSKSGISLQDEEAGTSSLWRPWRHEELTDWQLSQHLKPRLLNLRRSCHKLMRVQSTATRKRYARQSSFPRYHLASSSSSSCC